MNPTMWNEAGVAKWPLATPEGGKKPTHQDLSGTKVQVTHKRTRRLCRHSCRPGWPIATLATPGGLHEDNGDNRWLGAEKRSPSEPSPLTYGAPNPWRTLWHE